MQYFAASSNLWSPYHCPTTPYCKQYGLGFSPFAHHYLGNHFCFLFLWLLRCFSSPGSLIPTYIFSRLYLRLPYSDISGSSLASSSPERFVGSHVLHRLCVPRYPPLALISLTTIYDLSQLQFHVWLLTQSLTNNYLLLAKS